MKQKKLKLRCKNQQHIQETEKYLKSLEGKPCIFYVDELERLRVRAATPDEINMFRNTFPDKIGA